MIISKNVKIVIVMMITTIINIIIITNYFYKYVPSHFNHTRLLDKKYRCIRYFAEKEYYKYMHQSCQEYNYDYIQFVIEKSRYIYSYYTYNFIMINLCIIIYLI